MLKILEDWYSSTLINDKYNMFLIDVDTHWLNDWMKDLNNIALWKLTSQVVTNKIEPWIKYRG